MNRKLRCLVFVLLPAMIVVWSLPAEERPAMTPHQQLMHTKLVHTQSLLSALVQQDFGQMSEVTTRLQVLAKQQWLEDETPGYRARLKDFWTILEGIQSAVDDRNLDRASSAYAQLTISCVNCHKSLRNPSP